MRTYKQITADLWVHNALVALRDWYLDPEDETPCFSDRNPTVVNVGLWLHENVPSYYQRVVMPAWRERLRLKLGRTPCGDRRLFLDIYGSRTISDCVPYNPALSKDFFPALLTPDGKIYVLPEESSSPDSVKPLFKPWTTCAAPKLLAKHFRRWSSRCAIKRIIADCPWIALVSYPRKDFHIWARGCHIVDGAYVINSYFKLGEASNV